MIYIETEALLARYLARDQSHEVAIKFWDRIRRRIYASHHMTVLRPCGDDEIRALEYFEKFGEHKVSFTHCPSSVLDIGQWDVPAEA
ncbi:MAG TPA: hypothetical protein ENG73_06770 [Desulfobacterales bacterium]|nr:hypothetical protein [Desulfobacterales bacterium]